MLKLQNHQIKIHFNYSIKYFKTAFSTNTIGSITSKISIPRVIDPPLFSSSNLLVFQSTRIQKNTGQNVNSKVSQYFMKINDDKTWQADWTDQYVTGLCSLRRINPKTSKSLSIFGHMNTTKRLYLGVLLGHMPFTELHCRRPIIKSKEEKSHYSLAINLTDGFPCYSVFFPLFHTCLENIPVTICEILDLTGVPFQARLHSISIGYPIIGDNLSRHPKYQQYLVHNLSFNWPSNILLHLWKAEFLIEDNFECNSKIITSPDCLLPSLDLPQRNSLDAKLLKSLNPDLVLPEKNQNKFVEHHGFFHHVDSTNARKFYPLLIEKPYFFKNSQTRFNDNLKIKNPSPSKTIYSEQNFQNSVLSEQSLSYLYRVHQKLSDNHTPWDT